MTEALRLVEDSDLSLVSYSPADGWVDRHGAGYEMFHGGSYHVTNVAGGRVTFRFTGSYVAYYSDMNVDHDSFRVSVDGGPPQTESSYAPRWTNGSRLLFATPLSPGPHTLTITNVKPMWMGLDYFMYSPVKPAQSSTRSTTTTPPTAPTTTRKPTSSTPPAESSPASRSTTEIAPSESSNDQALLPQSESPAAANSGSPTAQGANADQTSPALAADSSSSRSESQGEKHSGLSPAPIYAAIGVACALLLCCLAVLIFFVRRRRRQRRREAEELALPPPAYTEADAWSALPVGSDDDPSMSQFGSPVVERTRLSAKSGGSRY